MITTKILNSVKKHMASIEASLKQALESAESYHRDSIRKELNDLQMKTIEADVGAQYGDAVFEELRTRIASETARAEFYELEKAHIAKREEHLERQSVAWEGIAAALKAVAEKLG